MDGELRTVALVAGRHVAEGIKSLLEAHGVACILYQEAGGAFGFSVGGLGRVEIKVSEAQFEQASRIIEQHQEHPRKK